VIIGKTSFTLIVDMAEQKLSWEWEIIPKTSWFGTSAAELIRHKDLLFQMVRRNYILYYQQTLLGPLWMIVNPLLTSMVYIVVFSRVIGIQTDGVPAFPFYFAGITLWTLFNDIFSGTSNIYGQNAFIFSKVYFPRIIVPLATTLLHLVRFGFQLLILICALAFYYYDGSVEFSMLRLLLVIPSIILTTMVALGIGLLLSVVTAKYKDLTNVLGLLTRLLMFICPIFYSVSIVPENLRWIAKVNPMWPLFELFRYAVLGVGVFDATQLLSSFAVAATLVTVGILLFNKTTDRLMDIV